MNFVAFNSIYRYITTYSSSLSQVLKLDCQAKIRLKIQRPKDQSPPPGHHSAVFEPSRAWPHQEVITLSFVFFYSASYGNKYIFSYTCGLWRKDRKACIACSLVLLQCRQGKMLRIFSIKVLVLSFQFLQVGSGVNFTEIN